MQNDFVYNSFKEIVEQFEVYIVQTTKNSYQFKLVKKPDRPKKPKITLEDLALRIDKVETLLYNIIKVNNLKTK